MLPKNLQNQPYEAFEEEDHIYSSSQNKLMASRLRIGEPSKSS
jgi:hypothetical protein